MPRPNPGSFRLGPLESDEHFRELQNFLQQQNYHRVDMHRHNGIDVSSLDLPLVMLKAVSRYNPDDEGVTPSVIFGFAAAAEGYNGYDDEYQHIAVVTIRPYTGQRTRFDRDPNRAYSTEFYIRSSDFTIEVIPTESVSPVRAIDQIVRNRVPEPVPVPEPLADWEQELLGDDF